MRHQTHRSAEKQAQLPASLARGDTVSGKHSRMSRVRFGVNKGNRLSNRIRVVIV